MTSLKSYTAFKTLGVISKFTGRLTNLKNSKNLIPNNLRDSIGLMIHNCIDSLTLISHVNSGIALRKNVSSESEFLFGDD